MSKPNVRDTKWRIFTPRPFKLLGTTAAPDHATASAKAQRRFPDTQPVVVEAKSADDSEVTIP